ncbi:reticulocyte-binding protein homolog 2a-like [Xenia sp. Carnegie-2017]|uniref:reticulocyte-binding protein homolog 2a-like n=1 Tax=Xenia sp. Carnegie-2017 TaxID=2897299 RepID=UPI001F03935D|nr:reticulocyte-binding protein homolog 2a-like [Xenia sp. Carnegie-2017]
MAEQFSSASSDCSSSTPRNSPISFVMKWTAKYNVELCKAVVLSRLFETRKKSLERGKVWEAVAKKKNNADKEAAEEIRRRAMENLSETRKRNESEQGGARKKVRKGGYSTLEFLREKWEKERKLREESLKLEREKIEMQRLQIQNEKESQQQFMEKQNQLLQNMIELQRQQNQQIQANQMLLVQQQQQLSQALVALLSKIADK